MSEKSYIKDIKSDDLQIGTVTKIDYYSYKGDLLIREGTVIESTHISALKNRFHDDLYVLFEEDTEGEEYSEEFISDDIFSDLDALEQAYKEDLEKGEIDKDFLLDDMDPEGEVEILEDEIFDDDFLDDDEFDDIPGFEQEKIIINNKDFEHISFGAVGLDQLLESNESKMIDNYVTRVESYSNPVGYAQKNKVVQISKEDRTEKYKENIHASYTGALKKVKELLISVASGSAKIDIFYVKNIVAEIIDVFNRDRSIMINMSNTRYSENEYIFKHALNTSILSINIALAYGYNLNQITDIAMGAILADVGMLLVPYEILDKPSKLDEEELAEVYKHPIVGSQMISRIIKVPPVVQFVAYQHHERVNGMGYPHGKSALHNYAKIVQIADIYEALTSHRPHRMGYTPFRAMDILSNMVNLKMIDQELFRAFIEFTSLFPIGSLVKLNDDRIAKVVATNSGVYSRPVVYVVIDEAGRVLKDAETYEVDLLESPTVSIVSSLRHDEVEKINIMRGF